MSGISQAYSQIREALAMLHNSWQQTSNGWNDVNQARFQRDYIEQFDAVIEPTLGTIEHLDRTIEQAYSAVLEG